MNPIRLRLLPALLIATFAIGACNRSNESTTGNNGQGGSPFGRGGAFGNAATTKPPEHKNVPVTRTFTILSGVTLPVTLDTGLSTKSDGAGTPFSATIHDPIVIDGINVVPAGSTVRGEVTYAKRAPRLGGRAEMTLRFREVVLTDGRSFQVAALPQRLQGKSSTKGDVEKVIGGAVGGGVLGGVLGGTKGATRGAVAGTVAGGVWAATTRGKDIYLSPGAVLNMTLAEDLHIPVTIRETASNQR